MELTVRTTHLGVIRAEVVRDDLYAAIDVSVDKLTRSLRKMKEKAVVRGNWPGRGGEKGAATISDAAPALASVDYDVLPSDEETASAKEPLDLPPSVKRAKVFYLDQMSVSVRCLAACPSLHSFPARLTPARLHRTRSTRWKPSTTTFISTWTRTRGARRWCTSASLGATA